MNGHQPLRKSQLFRLLSRKKLATLLELSLSDLESLANGGATNYTQFPRSTGPGKIRNVEWPKPRLLLIASKLNRLLSRIEPPPYLHSGLKGKSYITNALSHDPGNRVAKIDLKDFFPQASYIFVYQAFIKTFKCSPDVASLLCKLTTLNGHLPTGSPTSVILSFFAYKDMFDAINALSIQNGVTMTLIVDDMTFSGINATSDFLYKVRGIVKKYGLRAHKRRYFEPHENKLITGVTLTRSGPRVPHKRRNLLFTKVHTFLTEQKPDIRQKLARELAGRIAEANQVEPGNYDALKRFLKFHSDRTLDSRDSRHL